MNTSFNNIIVNALKTLITSLLFLLPSTYACAKNSESVVIIQETNVLLKPSTKQAVEAAFTHALNYCAADREADFPDCLNSMSLSRVLSFTHETNLFGAAVEILPDVFGQLLKIRIKSHLAQN